MYIENLRVAHNFSIVAFALSAVSGLFGTYNGICLFGHLSNRTILPKICLTGQFNFLGICLTGQLKKFGQTYSTCNVK